MARFSSVFFGLDSYAPLVGTGIAVVALAVWVFFGVTGFLRYRKDKLYRPQALYWMLLALPAFNALLALFAVLWKSVWWTGILAGTDSFLRYFQADRVYYLIPAVWYIVLGISLSLILEKIKIFSVIVAVAAAVLVFSGLIYHTFFYEQIRQVIFPQYDLMTWAKYYAEDVFDRIKEAIPEKREEYRVVSLGLPPAVALYNGFYCLDGYSNNYPLEYKHEFRKIIARELEQSEWNREYFDHWVSRCYVMAHETGANPMIAKWPGSTYHELLIDTAAIKAMGGRYIFSAMPVENPQELGLKEEGAFDTDKSFYRIWVYRIV